MEKLTGTFVQIYDLDVWGNEEDGYEVNDVYKGDIFEVPTNYNENDIFDLLKSQGFLKNYVQKDDIEIDMNEDFTEIFDALSGEPLWQIWDIKNDEVLWNAKNVTNVYNLDGDRLITWKDGTFEFGGV